MFALLIYLEEDFSIHHINIYNVFQMDGSEINRTCWDMFWPYLDVPGS